MKKFILLLAMFSVITTVKAQNEFITTRKTDNPGTSTDFQITIPATGEAIIMMSIGATLILMLV